MWLAKRYSSKLILFNNRISLLLVSSIQLSSLDWTNYFPDFTLKMARRAGSDGSMPVSGSAGPGFEPRRGNKFYF